MRRTGHPFLAAVVTALAAIATSAPPLLLAADPSPPLQIQFDANGLSSLKLNQSELLADGQVEVNRVRVGSKPVLGKAFSKVVKNFDPAQKTLDQTYSWGKLHLVYHPQTDRLVMDISVINTSSEPLTDVGFSLLKLQFPATPQGLAWEKRFAVNFDRPDEFPALVADWGDGRLALCNDDLNQFVCFGYKPLKGDPWAVDQWFGGGGVPAGKTRNAVISIRTSTSADHWEIVRDVLQKFAAKYPQELKWDDRRSICSAFLSTSIAGYKHNPRGWFYDRDLDVSTTEGNAKFKTELMTYADSVVSHCKAMNAQGVIVWDLEGQEMPHATSYLADPRILPKAAPEMDAVADEFFKRLSDGGLKTGITIRPTRVAPAEDGHGWTQKDVADPVAEMADKIEYARKRWGCRIFYLDSNVTFDRDAKGKIINDPAMPADDFRTLARRFNDCLLIPEHKTARYWAYTAPYSEFRLGFVSTPPMVRETYPKAFSVLRVVDGPPLDQPDNAEKLAAAIKAGDVFLFRGWWDDPETTKIKAIYDQAKDLHAASN